MDQLSPSTVTALRHAQNTLIEHSLDRISTAHPWYRTLPAASRDQIDTVARLGVTMFVDSVGEQGGTADPSGIFNVAPIALTGTVSLEQTLDLVRTVVDVVEEEAPDVAPAADHDAVRVQVLTFGRDVGFAAAKVYARVAEARGAWDARLEAVAVDAMLHDSADDAATRAGTAGWRGTGPVLAIVAHTVLDAMATSHLRHECRQYVQDCLVSVHGDSVIVVLGGACAPERPVDEPTPESELAAAADRIAAGLDGAVVIGPVVPGVAQAGRSLRSALAGLRALPGWADAPNPVRADDLLPERLLAGDPLAAEQIQVLVTEPLRAMGALYEETIATYLALGRSLEMTARALFVHANTVRYRLGRVSQQIGWDATDARDGLVLHLAVIVGRLAAAPTE
ncbi:PucR C-terminal helix-turn-helix domain-containing protein [Actinomyces ruminicola]|uniref:PucR C-terminal helix-turn-helix domain-containing protein n=1 Tax=Actinomyces ruminicola TaxID=332524 RepID=A0A1H0CC79_9ACTO|nr:helix-turn-helix domain-containing protein [Actinomyces ruminicola]SDN55423.1 PucR C-terminal helix-turn-helix domain-containing protein [Actinomyces ruminicola]